MAETAHNNNAEWAKSARSHVTFMCFLAGSYPAVTLGAMDLKGKTIAEVVSFLKNLGIPDSFCDAVKGKASTT